MWDWLYCLSLTSALSLPSALWVYLLFWPTFALTYLLLWPTFCFDLPSALSLPSALRLSSVLSLPSAALRPSDNNFPVHSANFCFLQTRFPPSAMLLLQLQQNLLAGPQQLAWSHCNISQHWTTTRIHCTNYHNTATISTVTTTRIHCNNQR